jgi:hypothetical protein
MPGCPLAAVGCESPAFPGAGVNCECPVVPEPSCFRASDRIATLQRGMLWTQLDATLERGGPGWSQC